MTPFSSRRITYKFSLTAANAVDTAKIVNHFGASSIRGIAYDHDQTKESWYARYVVSIDDDGNIVDHTIKVVGDDIVIEETLEAEAAA